MDFPAPGSSSSSSSTSTAPLSIRHLKADPQILSAVVLMNVDIDGVQLPTVIYPLGEGVDFISSDCGNMTMAGWSWGPGIWHFPAAAPPPPVGRVHPEAADPQTHRARENARDRTQTRLVPVVESDK